jgi:hypothetical protein
VTTTRDAEIARAIASGATAPAVAAEYDLTAQRVRQIARAAGVEPRRAGRPVTTGRGEARVHVRLSAAERDALAAVAGDADAIPAYLRGAGLALPQIVDALASAGDTLTEAVSRSAYVGRAIAAYLRLTSIAATLGTTPEAALDRLDPARSGEE